ncbi:Gfo/Idh/MocA family oxidoreductase [Microbacteriaceae bacterium VKM Ac-2854]|nr:Gfo/Idh/MocA family oxidoreductase [Microbacteriaceae bacterium VKM Ac-2854]
MTRERYALIGTGSRAESYIDAILGPHADVAELVAWGDVNPGRLDYYERSLPSDITVPLRFEPARLEAIVRERRIDRVIVTTPDFTHAEFVSRALLAGADVIVEKPITIDEAGLRRIADAIAASGRGVVTTFNYRYSPRNSALKQLVQSGAIGAVTSVTFEWVLDTVHGADYFRRWHRDKVNSGGLLIHKASHHFDLVNWWIDAAPRRVYASGGLRFYGAENARARGLAPRPERGGTDAFALDLAADPKMAALYREPERFDGYIRDRDVFQDGITIEDNLALVVDYDSGATLSYSLNAHSPWEGYRVSINGTLGRAELEVVERGAVIAAADGTVALDPSATPDADFGTEVRPAGERLVLQKHWQAPELVPIPDGIGGHGGGDTYLLQHLFGHITEDPLGRPAGYTDGVRAISVGIAGNQSLDMGVPISIPVDRA